MAQTQNHDQVIAKHFLDTTANQTTVSTVKDGIMWFSKLLSVNVLGQIK